MHPRFLYGVSELAHNLCGDVALTTDVDAALGGFAHADTLQVVVLNRSVGVLVKLNIVDASGIEDVADVEKLEVIDEAINESSKSIAVGSSNETDVLVDNGHGGTLTHLRTNVEGNYRLTKVILRGVSIENYIVEH